MRAIRDLTGMKFGRLTVIGRGENSKDGHPRWNCVCDCGNIKDIPVSADSLKRGKVTSCGCFRRERITKHNCSKERLYQIWHGMIKRCENKKDKKYLKYGARGITVFHEWHDYMVFREWALNNGYEEHLTIDRIDNKKGYYPDNCRWATNKQQCNNKTNNVNITIDGVTHTIAEWGDITGVNRTTIKHRYEKGIKGKDIISKTRLNAKKLY